MSSPRCSICFSPDQRAIDDVLVAGGKLIPTAAQFGLSKSALGRHRAGCLAPQLAAAAKLMAHPSETRAPVVRAKAIVAGEPAAFSETLALTGLLERLGRSLERLEDAADHASREKALAALAAVSGQLHRGIEAAAKIQGIGNVQPPAGGAGVFSVTINLDGGAAEAMRVIEGRVTDPTWDAPMD